MATLRRRGCGRYGAVPEPPAGEAVRKRTQGINVRVTAQEKQRIERNAAASGLTLSEYIRKRATGYRPKYHPPQKLFNALLRADALADTLEQTEPEIAAQLRLCTDEARNCILLTNAENGASEHTT